MFLPQLKKYPADAEISPLVDALNATAWIVTVASCSGIHDGAIADGTASVELATVATDTPRLAALLDRIQGADDENLPLVSCELSFHRSVATSYNEDDFPGVAFFWVRINLTELKRADGCAELERIAKVVRETA